MSSFLSILAKSSGAVDQNLAVDKGNNGDVLISTTTGFSFVAPTTFTPNLSQVLVSGNTATNNINLNGNITANTFIGNLTGLATTSTNISGGAGGSIPYQTAANTTALLANGTAGQVLTSAGTTLAPTWTAVSLPTPSTATSMTIGTFVLNTNYFITYVDSSNAVVGSPVANGFTIYRFAPSSTTTGNITASQKVPVSYFIVGGGGGGAGGLGGTSSGGGGGGGGFQSGDDFFYTGATYTLSVGAGGLGGTGADGTNGTISYLSSFNGTKVAFGGGAGGMGSSTALATGNSVQGSGGGGGSGNAIGGVGGASYSQQGSFGGTAISGAPFQAGGGGGATEKGATAGTGGAGTDSFMLGGTTANFYCGGGGGGNNTGSAKVGGTGGGGTGGVGTNNGTAGTANTGGGGGGGGVPEPSSSTNGGNGGSGIVIFRIPSFV